MIENEKLFPQTQMNRLKDKVAVVTGSTKGIGKAIAEKFCSEGATVVISSRSEAKVKEVESAFRQKNYTVKGIACDVANEASVNALASETVKAFGKIDIWLNNAGVADPFARITEKPFEAWYAPIETNVKGTFFCCRAALGVMLPQGHGKIINMAGAGVESYNTPFISGYGSSKAAIWRFTKSIAEEYKDMGIDIVLLNPGLVRTEILSTQFTNPELMKRLKTFDTVRDIFGQPPSVAAELAVKLAGSWSDGKAGTYLNALNKWRSYKLLATYPFRKWRGTIDRTEY
jgi:glucose 1-dehydrogenase